MFNEREKTMRRFKSICYIHGPDVGMICLALFGVVVELACGYSIGINTFFGQVAYHAALIFLIAALLAVWSIVRFEQRYA